MQELTLLKQPVQVQQQQQQQGQKVVVVAAAASTERVLLASCWHALA
jgi:hypothetical protein